MNNRSEQHTGESVADVLMAAVHTPGPWRKCGGMTPKYCAITSADGYIVFGMADAVCDREGNGNRIKAPDMDTQQANARLIAAAPDFFAAASSLVEAWDARTTGAQQIITGKSDADLQKQAMQAIEDLRTALSKAKSAEA